MPMLTATQDPILPIFSSFDFYQEAEQSLDIPGRNAEVRFYMGGTYEKKETFA